MKKDNEQQCPAGKSGEDATSTCATLASNDSEPSPSLMDGARAVQIVFAAEESSRTGRPIAVPRL